MAGADEERDPAQRRWTMLIVANLLVAVPVVTLLASNSQDVELRWLGLEWKPPMFVVLLIAFVLGALVDQVFGLVWRLRRRRAERLRHELEELRRAHRLPDDPE